MRDKEGNKVSDLSQESFLRKHWHFSRGLVIRVVSGLQRDSLMCSFFLKGVCSNVRLFSLRVVEIYMKDLEFRSRAGMIDGDARFGSCNLCSSELHFRFFTWSSRCVLELLGCATCQGGAWLGYVFFCPGPGVWAFASVTDGSGTGAFFLGGWNVTVCSLGFT